MGEELENQLLFRVDGGEIETETETDWRGQIEGVEGKEEKKRKLSGQDRTENNHIKYKQKDRGR